MEKKSVTWSPPTRCLGVYARLAARTGPGRGPCRNLIAPSTRIEDDRETPSLASTRFVTHRNEPHLQRCTVELASGWGADLLLCVHHPFKEEQ